MLKSSRLLGLVLLFVTLLSLGAVLLFDRGNAQTSVFTLANLVGPTADSLLHSHGLSVCTDAMGTPGNPLCFHAARMPLASVVVALGATLLGDHFLSIALFKTALFLLPMLAAMHLAGRRLPGTGWRLFSGLALLLVPFLLTPFLADVVNMQVEEGYAYSLLALACALTFTCAARAPSLARAVLFAVSVALLYLAKSSLAPAVAVLALCYLWPLRRSPAVVALTLLLIAAAPAGWALWQHHASGRYTLGTSLDGINLHKGNNAAFLAHYPPPPGSSLDQYDSDLNRGHTFHDEWAFNDFHQRAALLFMRSHPQATEQGDLRKLTVIFLSPHKLGSGSSSALVEHLETAGILVFHLLLWAALLLATTSLALPRLRPVRPAGVAFLLLVAAICLPYVLGFAYTRHASVLIAPSTLFLCAVLACTGRSRPAVTP